VSACSFAAAFPTSLMARTTSVTLTLVMLLLAAAGAAPDVGRYSAAADVGRYKVLSFKKGVGPGTGCPDPDGSIGEPGCPNDCSLTCRQAGRRALRNRGGGMVCTDDLNNFDCNPGAPAGSRCNASLTWLQAANTHRLHRASEVRLLLRRGRNRLLLLLRYRAARCEPALLR